MKKASLVVHPAYAQDRMFDPDNKTLNRDDCLSPMRELKKQLLVHGIDLHTNDINTPETSEVVIYNEMPRQLPPHDAIEKSYLILLENKLVRPRDWSEEKFSRFKKIFTWNDAYIDGKKFIKLNFAQVIITKIPKSFESKKLCAIISGNKASTYGQELYSKRVEAVQWFEKHHPQDLDLFGMGWHQRTFSGIFRHFNRFSFLRKWGYGGPPSLFRGIIDKKIETLQKYKFSICFENITGEDGYITEKLFDCFFSGCVPVYLGAPNVEKYVPKNCFIDWNDHGSFESVYTRMQQMPADEYFNYLNNIEKYLNSQEILQFSSPFFAKTIVQEIVKEALV